MSVRNTWVVLAVVAVVFAGCSSDPTTSDEYRALEAERAALEADLASAEAERAALEAQIADLEAPGTETAAPEIMQLLEDYLTAINANDGDGYRAVVAEDLVALDTTYHFSEGGVLVKGSGSGSGDDFATELDYKIYEWHAELVGQPIVVGQGPWIVSSAEEWRESTTNTRFQGVNTYVVDDEDGTLKVIDKLNISFQSALE